MPYPAKTTAPASLPRAEKLNGTKSWPLFNAVILPADKIDEMMGALEGLVEREARIIRAANDPGMTVERIKEAIWKQS